MVRGGPPLGGRGRGRATTEAASGSGEPASSGRGGGVQGGTQPPGDARTQQLEAEVAALKGQLTALTGMFQQFLQQQTAAAAPPALPQTQTALETVDPPVVPTQAAAPTVATTTTTTVPPGGADTPAAEGARIRAKLGEFLKFDPLKFTRKKDDGLVLKH